MPKPSAPTKRASRDARAGKEKRRLSVEFTNHHDLLLNVSKAIEAVGIHLGSTVAPGRKGLAVAATQKSFIGYDEALKIVLECSGRTGPEDPVFDSAAPPATKDAVVQCILKHIHDEGFTLPGPLAIGDTETCDAVAAEVQYASN